jgi:hypothetical protein
LQAGSPAIGAGVTAYYDPPTDSLPITTDQAGVTHNSPPDLGALTDIVPAPSATYLGDDTTTHGSWIGVYGSQGSNVINATNGVDYPSYATVTPAGNRTYTWAASTSAPQALQDAPPATSRIAACWYSNTSFTVDVDLTDGQSHNLELYLLDKTRHHVASRSCSPMPTPMPS